MLNINISDDSDKISLILRRIMALQEVSLKANPTYGLMDLECGKNGRAGGQQRRIHGSMDPRRRHVVWLSVYISYLNTGNGGFSVTTRGKERGKPTGTPEPEGCGTYASEQCAG